MDIMKYAQWVLDTCPELVSLQNQGTLEAFGKSEPRAFKVKEQGFKEIKEDKIKDNFNYELK